MPTTDPTTGWRIPTLPDPADGPDAFKKLAADAAASVMGPNVSSYVPGWGSAGSIQPVSPSSIVGRFRVQQKWCDIWIALQFSASTGGGSGYLYLTLPITPSSEGPQRLGAVFYSPGHGYFNGFGRVDAGLTNMYPHFPISAGSNVHDAWRNTDATAAIGTGIPVFPGAYGILAGGFLVVSGTYLVP